jgi:hypothetical protein
VKRGDQSADGGENLCGERYAVVGLHTMLLGGLKRGSRGRHRFVVSCHGRLLGASCHIGGRTEAHDRIAEIVGGDGDVGTEPTGVGHGCPDRAGGVGQVKQISALGQCWLSSSRSAGVRSASRAGRSQARTAFADAVPVQYRAISSGAFRALEPGGRGACVRSVIGGRRSPTTWTRATTSTTRPHSPKSHPHAHSQPDALPSATWRLPAESLHAEHDVPGTRACNRAAVSPQPGRDGPCRRRGGFPRAP